jgi:DNA polymerase-3 subunit epsilon
VNAADPLADGISGHHQAILTARHILDQRPVFLDTETTGLDYTAEIVEISIVDSDGIVLYQSLVRPRAPIPVTAARIHHITDRTVEQSPAWPDVWPIVRTHLAARLIAIYNDEYDLRLMQQSHYTYRMPWTDRLNTACIMKLYAQFRGEWDAARRSYRYHSLANASAQCGLKLASSHRATADALLTRSLLLYMASQVI